MNEQEFKPITVSVVGLGLIGGSMGLDLKARGYAGKVIGVDNSENHGRQALDLELVDRVDTLDSALRAADLVIVATPVTTIAKVLPEVLDKVRPGTTVTDVGSTKTSIAAAIKDHPKRKQCVLSHPMAGTENSGPTAALQGLFYGKTAVICDKVLSGPEHVKRVEDMYDALDMRRTYMGSSDHDMHAAFVSHLSHVSSFILANTVLDIEKDVSSIFDLAGGGFESTVRLAKSNPDMWLPIFEQNQKHVVTALDAYIKHLTEFRSTLIEKRWPDLRKLLENANRIRRVLQNMKGPWRK